MEWFVRNDVFYETKKYTSPANLSFTPELWQWNGRIGLENDTFTAAFYIDNITNEKSPLQIQSFPLFDAAVGYQPAGDVLAFQNSYLISPRRERNMGATITVRFGQNR